MTYTNTITLHCFSINRSLLKFSFVSFVKCGSARLNDVKPSPIRLSVQMLPLHINQMKPNKINSTTDHPNTILWVKLNVAVTDSMLLFLQHQCRYLYVPHHIWDIKYRTQRSMSLTKQAQICESSQMLQWLTQFCYTKISNAVVCSYNTHTHTLVKHWEFNFEAIVIMYKSPKKNHARLKFKYSSWVKCVSDRLSIIVPWELIRLPVPTHITYETHTIYQTAQPHHSLYKLRCVSWVNFRSAWLNCVIPSSLMSFPVRATTLYALNIKH